MAHDQQFDYIASVREKYPLHFTNARVLEIGSLNINGTVRQFFTDCEYIGLDVGPGKDVDLVCEGQNYDAPDNTFHTVISSECFEHNPYWKETFANMIRLCKPNGLVVFTCATEGRKEHGTTRTCHHSSPLTIDHGWGDYYQNLIEEDFRKEFDFDTLFSKYEFSNNTQSFDLYFWGIKK